MCGWLVGSIGNNCNVGACAYALYLNQDHLLLLSHIQHAGPLIVPGLVPELHQDVGVEGHHDYQGYHKNDQENSSEVSFLDILWPPTEVAGTLFPLCVCS